MLACILHVTAWWAQVGSLSLSACSLHASFCVGCASCLWKLSASAFEGWSCEVQMSWCVKMHQDPCQKHLPHGACVCVRAHVSGRGRGTLSLCLPGLMGVRSSIYPFYFICGYQSLKDRDMFYSMPIALNNFFHTQVLNTPGPVL